MLDTTWLPFLFKANKKKFLASFYPLGNRTRLRLYNNNGVILEAIEDNLDLCIEKAYYKLGIDLDKIGVNSNE